jgi:thioredoxin reductase
MTEPRQQRTLFQQLTGLRRREGRAKLRVHAPSDVTRFVPVWIGAALAAIGVLIAWRIAPPGAASGALALPHARAGLSCQSCHGASANGDSPAGACKGCHGAHSLRGAHQSLFAEKRIGCVDCHDVHGADQGVRFTSDGTLRYGVAAWRRLDEDRSDRNLTVVLVPLSRCARCHDPTASSDPIARCRSGDLLALGERAPSLCFDEHREAKLFAGASKSDGQPGVCGANHAADRLATWERARAVAHAAPEPPARSIAGHAPWLLAGVGGGVLGVVLGRIALALARRRRERARRATVPELALVAPVRRLPVIDTSTCLGCYACVDACPYDVLRVERYVAVVDRPEACCGLTLCEQVCPNGSLQMQHGAPSEQSPLLGQGLRAQHASGIYLAGDITGVPLIKNAILQGTKAVEQIHADLPKRHGLALDLLIVGAGPAGIAAALRAKELGLAFEVIEQGSVAQSIRSFPRGKLVFDQPLELPVAGNLWLQESTKEELLAQWLRIVKSERLPIVEQHRLTALSRREVGFEAEIAGPNGPTTRRAARALLAIGMRGSPRRLPIDLPESVESKVFYHLADARSFVGQRVLVVGLGDSAMEAAIALAHQSGTEVTISYRGSEITRGKRRNIDELRRLLEARRVRLIYESQVKSISPSEVVLSTTEGDTRMANDAVLVLIGSLAPKQLLTEIGVLTGAG